MRPSGRRAHDRAMTHAPTTPTPPPSPTGSTRTAPVVEVRDLREAYGRTEVLRGVSFAVAAGRAVRPARHQRRRQDHHGRDPPGPAPRRRRLGPGARPRPAVGRRPAAPPDRRPAPGRRPARPHAGRRGAAAVRLAAPVAPAARRAGRRSGSSSHLWRRPFGALSGGERQRLFVALALVGRPRLVFLDELTQNLDPVGRRHTWDVVRRVRDGGTTVVLVTHDVEEAERLCDRIVVLDRGRVVADGHARRRSSTTSAARTTVSFTDADLDVRAAARPARRRRRRPPRPRGRGSTGTGPVLAHVGAHLVGARPAALDLRVERPRSRTASSPSPRRSRHDRHHHAPSPPHPPRRTARLRDRPAPHRRRAAAAAPRADGRRRPDRLPAGDRAGAGRRVRPGARPRVRRRGAERPLPRRLHRRGAGGPRPDHHPGAPRHPPGARRRCAASGRRA